MRRRRRRSKCRRRGIHSVVMRVQSLPSENHPQNSCQEKWSEIDESTAFSSTA